MITHFVVRRGRRVVACEEDERRARVHSEAFARIEQLLRGNEGHAPASIEVDEVRNDNIVSTRNVIAI